MLPASRVWTPDQGPFASRPDVVMQAPGGTLVAWRDPILARSRLYLLPGEVLLGVLRPDIRGVLGPLINAIGCSIAIGLIIGPTSLTGAVVSAIITAISLSIRTIAALIGTRYYLTSRRLVMSHEYLWTEEVSMHLDRIQQVKADQGILARLFDAGTVRVRSAASSRSNPGQAQREVSEQRRNVFHSSIGVVLLRGVIHPRAVRSVIQWVQSTPSDVRALDPSVGPTATHPANPTWTGAETAAWEAALAEARALRAALERRATPLRTG